MHIDLLTAVLFVPRLLILAKAKGGMNAPPLMPLIPPKQGGKTCLADFGAGRGIRGTRNPRLEARKERGKGRKEQLARSITKQQ